MKIYLIRHAKIETTEEVVQGTVDPIVNDDETIAGIKRAQLEVVNPDNIYCSELIRAKQTAGLIFPDRADVVYTPLINEYVRPSRFIGASKAELVQFWEDHKNDKYDPDWKPEDGESYAEIADRAALFHKLLLEDKEKGCKTVAVVAHGTFFRHLACSLTGMLEWRSNPRIVIDLLRKFPWNHLEVKEFEI